MIYILYHNHDKEAIEEKVTPLLEEKEYELITYPKPDFTPEGNSILITYLNDEYLREFIPRAAKENWTIGILPHPEIVYTIKGLGISGDLEEVMDEILNKEENQKLDLLFCNGEPVFQAVNLGHVFLFSEKRKGKNSFFQEVSNFIKNIRRLSSLSHQSYYLSSEDEKILHTSALGIVVVEHPLSSVVARRLVSKSAMNDGIFNVLILSPQNLLELFLFLFRSLLPKRERIEKLPSFIGHIKISELKIENNSEIKFTIDGQKESAKEINFSIEHEALILHQASIYCTDENGADEKKSLRANKLPSGEKREELTKRKLPILPRATTEEFQELFKLLRENAKTSSAYIIMMILAALISTFGLFADSSPVIIGAMILAPIISPIVSFSMGMVRYDTNMLKSGIITILIGTVVSLLFSAGVTIFVPLKSITSEIDARLTPTILDMGIAVASGVAAAYAHAKESIAQSLAGVAIAVALVPPLAVAGIGIGWWDWEVFSGAFLLYLTNMAGIIMFAGITFLILGFAPFKRARLGLIYTFIILVLVMVPLSLSFNRIQEETSITRKLEGESLNDLVLRDVKVRYGTPLRVSLKLVGTQSVDANEMQAIKEQIEKDLDRKIILEVVSAREF